MGRLTDCLSESNFGKAINCVEIVDIRCNRTTFVDVKEIDGTPRCNALELNGRDIIADIDEIERYSCAVTFAKRILARDWFLTDEDYLVCGVHSKPLPMLKVTIDIDGSIATLNNSKNLYYKSPFLSLFSAFRVKMKKIPDASGKNEQRTCKFI